MSVRSSSVRTVDPGRPAKRVKYDIEDHVALETRAADFHTALEVDLMMLDFLSYQTTTACLAEAARRTTPRGNGPSSLSNLPKGPTKSSERNLSTFNTLYKLFTSSHEEYQLDAELRFRILLCKFVVLITTRFSSCHATPGETSLAQLRSRNQERARAWIGRPERLPSAAFDAGMAFDESLPTSQDQLMSNRAHVLHELNVAAEYDQEDEGFYGTPSCVALLDVLPLFMQVSAAQNAMCGSNVTEFWMRLTGEFMLQACLEQYLICGANGTDAIDEAFAWGYGDTSERMAGTASSSTVTKGKDEAELDTMFEDEVYETEIDGWTDVKKSFLHQLLPPSVRSSDLSADVVPPDCNDQSQPPDFASCLVTATSRHPVAVFERKLLAFLGALASSTPEPILLQLEKGQLDGMSEAETRDFLRDCGLDSTLFSNGSSR